MSGYLFLSWDGAGNQVPALALAADLVGRGHTVVFGGYASQRERVEAAGFEFRELRGAQRAWPTTPPDDWMPALVGAVWACPAHLEDVPALLAETRCDVLVVDCLMFGALAAAERASIPAIVLVHSAPGALLPPGGGLDFLALDAVNRVRAEAGLTSLPALWDAWQPFRSLATSVPELDPLAGGLPPGIDFVGRLTPASSGTWRSPWPDDDRRPLALVSFSTGIAWDESSRIRRTVAALGDGSLRVLVTGSTPAGFEPTGDVAATPYVPHDLVLPGAAVTITHAGHGTVAASLAHGVPLVALPHAAADQPALAARVTELGAGLAVDGESATPSDIAAAVHRVLDNSSFAAAAARLGGVFARYRGRAVDALCAAG